MKQALFSQTNRSTMYGLAMSIFWPALMLFFFLLPSVSNFKSRAPQGFTLRKWLNQVIKTSRGRTSVFLTIILFCFFVPFLASAAAVSMPANNLGLVGYWSFDEGTSTQAGDRSGFGNNGSFVNMDEANWTAGKRGSALTFNGTTSYVDAGDINAVDTATTLSVCAWVKHNSINSDDAIVTKITSGNADGFMLWRDDVTQGSQPDTYTLYVGDSTGSDNARVDGTPNTSPLGAWTHVCGTFMAASATGLRLYINGVEDANSPASANTIAAINAGTSGVRIGDWSFQADKVFDGVIDEVRIYNRVLSAGEVKKLYESGSVRLQAANRNGLIMELKFDEGVGDQAGDSSANSNHGPITGATWTSGKFGKALFFDGTDDEIVMSGPVIASNQTFTVAGWVKADLSQSLHLASRNIDINNKKWSVSVNTNGSINVRHVNTAGTYINGTSSAGLVRPNEWHHIVAIYNFSTSGKTLYVDGVAQALSDSTLGTLHATNPNTPLYIGRDRNGFGRGSIDDFRIYNRALSVSEVQSLYNVAQQTINSSQADRLTSGLVAYWPFNGTDFSGNATLDRSSGSNNARVWGPTKTIGKVGQGLYFDGVNDYVCISSPTGVCNSDSTNATFEGAVSTRSISIWFKVDSLSATPQILYEEGGENNGLNFYVHTNGDLYAGAWGTTISNQFLSAPIEVGRWHHAVSVYTTSNFSFYLDGEFVTSGNTNGTIPAHSGDGALGAIYHDSNLHTGSVSGHGSRFFNGSLDEVRVYDAALTAAEIKQLYNLGR